MIQYNTTNKILPSALQICITGNDPLQTHALKEELSLRFGKRIHMNVFKTEAGCINFINQATDIAFFVGLTSMGDDYSEEISIRKKVRLKSPLTDVFVLYNEAQKTEAMRFLYDITNVNAFGGACRLSWRYWITTPITYILKIFKRRSTIAHGIQAKPIVLKKMETSPW